MAVGASAHRRHVSLMDRARGLRGRVLLYMVYALPASSYMLKHCRE